MIKNPFKDRPEETKRSDLLYIGQRVLIIEKHKQGTKDLTDCYILSFLTSKGRHPQGVKVVGIRRSYIEGKDIKDIDPETATKKISTRAGELDINKYCIGRVQFLGENELNIEPGDLVVVTKSKKHHYEKDKVEGIVQNVIQYELIDNKQKTQVELMDGTIGWVCEIIEKV